MKLSIDQEQALDNIMEFLGSNKTEYVLTGGPGVGKSFVTKELLDMIHERSNGKVMVYLTATTNRAASVLGSMCDTPAQTIHKLLNLSVKDNYETGISSVKKGKRRLNLYPKSLVICDEASMADRNLHAIILYYADQFNMKILYVGDKYQLSPVFSSSSVFQHVKELSELTTVHRQGEGSSILYEAAKYREMLRNNEPNFKSIKNSSDITIVDKKEFYNKIEEVFRSDNYTLNVDHAKILAWTNKTVTNYSNYVRNLFYSVSCPMVGEHLIVSSNSNMDIPFKTEDTVEVVSVTSSNLLEISGYKIELIYYNTNEDADLFDKETFATVFMAKDFNDVKLLLKEKAKEAKLNRNWRSYFETKAMFIDLRPMYASTVHKAQGGSMNIIFMDLDDIGKNTKWNEVARLIYVALTRARHHVYITGSLPDRLLK